MCQSAAYRPWRPRSSPLYRLLQDHYDRLALVHDERFRRTHGRLHAGVEKVVQRFLDCGLLESGFVRLYCPGCCAGFLVAFSCKCRYLCPACHARRLLVWSEWLEQEILDEVEYRMVAPGVGAGQIAGGKRVIDRAGLARWAVGGRTQRVSFAADDGQRHQA